MTLTVAQTKRLATSRHAFSQRARHGSRLDFDRLAALYATPTRTFADIARTIGLSRERARQLYHQYFAAVWPHATGPHRRRSRARDQTRTRRPRNDLMAIVAEAERRGYAWERDVTPHGRARLRALVINGKRCWLSTTKTPWMGQYIRLPIGIHNTMTADVLFCVAEIAGVRRRVFVVPAAWVRTQPRGRFAVLRMAAYGTRGPRPGTHVADFVARWEDAWDAVLGPPKAQRVA